jgi:hypothetical protein
MANRRLHMVLVLLVGLGTCAHTYDATVALVAAASE